MVGRDHAVSQYVGDLVRSGVDLRAFVPTETPLEALFFMLTDDPERAAGVCGAAREEAAAR